jgi:DNA-binding Lrp family transcriptional regulator
MAEYNLDTIDWKILNILQSDARCLEYRARRFGMPFSITLLTAG